MPNSAAPSAKPIARSMTKGRLKRLIPLVSGLVILAIGLWWAWGKLHAGPSARLITAKVTRGDLIETISAAGSVTAETGAEVHIGSQISGTLKRLNADVGSQVKAGDLIAELDLPDLRDQLHQAQANLAQARTKYAQQLAGIDQTVVQTATNLTLAQQSLASSKERLRVAQANASQQALQTPSDIQRAIKNLSTARSTYDQTKAGANLQIQNAEESLAQAKANATNSAANLARYRSLYEQGFVSKSDVDAATAQDGVYQSQVRSATQNVELAKQKVAADLQAASDAVDSAQAALDAAQGETNTIAARKADVADAEASVRQANANLSAALANRVNDSLKRQDVELAKQGVEQAQALVDYDNAQLNKAYIRTPISGTVLQLAAQQGETVAAGLSTQTLLIVADLNRLQVDAYVDETDIGRVKIGQPAQCTIDAFPGRTFDGTVTKIASGSTIQQGVVTYDVTIGIKDKRHQLKPDMTASVNIQTGRIKDALLVPAVAVQTTTSGATVNVVTMADGNRTVVPTIVQTGGTDGVNIEIKSGLSEGDTIVLAGGQSTGPMRGPSSPFGPQRGGGRGRGG